ncbi:MAG: hypothetical protein ABEL97_06610 [Salinibacter sp.]
MLFPPSDAPLRRRIRLMGVLMVGITLSMTLVGVLVEAPQLWRRGDPVSFASALALRAAVCAGLSGLPALPSAAGTYVVARTGYVQLLFSVCLILFFVGFALRTFLFFDYVQAHLRDIPGPAVGPVAVGAESLASTALVALLGGLLRRL